MRGDWLPLVVLVGRHTRVVRATPSRTCYSPPILFKFYQSSSALALVLRRAFASVIAGLGHVVTGGGGVFSFDSRWLIPASPFLS